MTDVVEMVCRRRDRPALHRIEFGRLAAGLLVMIGCTSLAAREPAVTPGLDPGGPTVVLISQGIDYRLPEIAARLARDGEGEMLGLDLVDGDNRPFAPVEAAGTDGTHAARSLASAGVRIVPIRIPEPTSLDAPLSLARGLAAVAGLDARVVLVIPSGGEAAPWQLFARVAKELPHITLVLPITGAGVPAAGLTRGRTWPAAFELANALIVAGPDDPDPRAHLTTAEPIASTSRGDTPGTRVVAAAIVAAALATCHSPLLAVPDPAARKRSLLMAARRSATSSLPALPRCANADPAR